MNLTVVGCSGSFPSASSPASCYLLTSQDEDGRTWRIVIDLGSGALGPLQQHLQLDQIDAVLLSHLHADHCLDVCGLYVALRYDPARAGQLPSPVLVAGPEGTLEHLANAYGLEDPDELGTVFDLHTWEERDALQLGPFRVTPYEVNHPVEAFGLRVEADGAVMAYTGDTDACPALYDLADGAHLLLAEASFIEGRDDALEGIHLTGKRAGELAEGAGVGKLVLTHIPVWNDPQVSLAEATAVFSGPIELASSGASWEITG